MPSTTKYRIQVLNASLPGSHYTLLNDRYTCVHLEVHGGPHRQFKLCHSIQWGSLFLDLPVYTQPSIFVSYVLPRGAVVLLNGLSASFYTVHRWRRVPLHYILVIDFNSRVCSSRSSHDISSRLRLDGVRCIEHTRNYVFVPCTCLRILGLSFRRVSNGFKPPLVSHIYKADFMLRLSQHLTFSTSSIRYLFDFFLSSILQISPWTENHSL